MILYSHRGLDSDRSEKLLENSLPAFEWAAKNGFGIELDLQMTSDGVMAVSHDPLAGPFAAGMTRFEAVLELARRASSLQLAVHVKGSNQSSAFLDKLAESLAKFEDVHSRILIFDLTRASASRLRRALHTIALAPSIAHAEDIARFQKLTNGTLFAFEDVVRDPGPFDWLWLDEWDRAGGKALYTADVFQQARAAGLKTAVISPELHKAEKHQDAENLQTLEKRWREIVAFRPDAICTDYPARLFASLKTS